MCQARQGMIILPLFPPGVFETSDGFINIAVAGEHIWMRFKETLADPRMDSDKFIDGKARSENRKALNALINENFRTETSAYWIDKMNEVGVPCGEINTIDKVFQSPQVQHLGIARDMVSTERGPTQIVGQPIVMSDLPLKSANRRHWQVSIAQKYYRNLDIVKPK